MSNEPTDKRGDLTRRKFISTSLTGLAAAGIAGVSPGLAAAQEGGEAPAEAKAAEEVFVVERAARNLPDVKTLRASYLNIRDLLGYDTVLMSLDSLQVIEGILGSAADASEPKA